MNIDYRKRIIIDPKIHFSKPCIAGTRIPVENVLELIQEGIHFEEIIKQYYPDLTIEDVKACAQYGSTIQQSTNLTISNLSRSQS